MANKKLPTKTPILIPAATYHDLFGDVAALLDTARRTSARAVNAIMTATYWEIGRRIVEVEQRQDDRAVYGEVILKRLANDLTKRFGRGFSWQNLYRMRNFYSAFPEIFSTLSRKSGTEHTYDQIFSTLSRKSSDQASSRNLARLKTSAKSSKTAKALPRIRETTENIEILNAIAMRFPLPWSHYVKLLTVDDAKARRFYEQEALRGGWSVRQLDRQISTQFFQRTLLSRNKAAMLRKGAESIAEDLVTVAEEIKDPFILEFLDLKDEYSEQDLEDALIRKLEEFMLELGGDFAFLGRQRRLRIGDEWYRIDLLFFHRRLKCIVIIDLKIGKYTHADAGQMNLYLNYAREHWTNAEENPPVGLILCAKKDEAVAHYSLEGLPNKVMAAEYRMVLPNEKLLAAELKKTQRELELRGITLPDKKTSTRQAAQHKREQKNKSN